MENKIDKNRVVEIYSRPCDEWTEEEAAYVHQYEEECIRQDEERERKMKEREVESKRLISEYWKNKVQNTQQPANTAEVGSLEWFINEARQSSLARIHTNITKHTDKVDVFLAKAYEIEVERRCGTMIKDDYTMRVIADVASWAVNHTKPGLLLRGNVGVGKTTLMLAMSKVFDVIEHQQIRIMGARRIAQIAKDNRDEFESLMRRPLLGIDDLGTEPLTVKNYGTESLPIVELLTERYNNRMFTVVSTNLVVRVDDNGEEHDEIGIIYGDRLMDRVKEMFDVLSYMPEQPSYRR